MGYPRGECERSEATCVSQIAHLRELCAFQQQVGVRPEDVCTSHGVFVGPCFAIHARMYGANGSPSYRIVVRPVTPDTPGLMRLVCVASASHIVTRPVLGQPLAHAPILGEAVSSGWMERPAVQLVSDTG